MKKLSVLLITTIMLFGCADSNANDTNGLEWHTNIEKAIEVATKENKPILVQFSGSDWCKWCVKLNDEVLNTKEFAEYAKDNIILVNLDDLRRTPQPAEVKEYNRAQMSKYGVRGFPTVLLMDKGGNVVKVTGYQEGGPEMYIEHIKEAYSPKG